MAFSVKSDYRGGIMSLRLFSLNSTARSLCISKKVILSLITIAAVGVGCTKSGSKKNVGKAPEGTKGTFYYVLQSEPQNLNPINMPDLYSRYVLQLTHEGLLNSNLDSGELEPGLAERWEESEDGKSITFYLRKGVKFHNGEELDAETVKWNFEIKFDDAYQAFSDRGYLENFDHKNIEVIDKYTIKFNIKKKYFANLDAIASYSLMALSPKSVYGDPKNKKKMNRTAIGTGPYKLAEYKKGQSIILEANPDWWGRTATDKDKIESVRNAYKFEKIFYRFVKDETLRLEMLKKGKIDYDELTAEQYVKKAVGEPWGTKVLKKEVKNKKPVRYGFIAWNFKEKMFQDKKVRRALAHLMNRELMIEKFRFGKALPATGPWYQQSPYANPSVKAIAFNPKKAAKMLKEAGWEDTDKDGTLDKVIGGNKKDFRFTMIYSNRDAEKYYTIYKEDLKKAGIDMVLKLVEWNSLVKALDERKFEAISLAWGGGSVDNDPKQIWHSDSAKGSGSNFISYSNPEVDKLIDEGRQIIDDEKRKVLWKKVYKLIADDAPYAFMFNQKYWHYAMAADIGQPKETFTYDIGKRTWFAKF